MNEIYLKVTGERIVTPAGGFNASWQRHLACYSLTARFLGPGTVLDLGCGTGHAQSHLESRRSVGVDLDAASLEVQGREAVRADMRRLPFKTDGFGSVACIHAIEHVPDPDRVVGEVARVLEPGGVAVFVTPNRLTFGRPDEIIDPYHYIEFDSDQLADLCRPRFGDVRSYGIFGSERYMEFFNDERQQLAALLRLDPLRLRRFVPRRVRQVLYDWKLSRARSSGDGPASALTIDDFELRVDGLQEALDVVAICRPAA